MKKKCILYPEQYALLWKTSWLSLLSALYGIYTNYLVHIIIIKKNIGYQHIII
jgi:hypothetical protein